MYIPSLAFLNLGPWEIALILFLALLLFGGKKLPGLAKDLGQGIREFRRSLSASPEDDAPPPVVREETHPVGLDDKQELSYTKSSVKKSSAKKASAKKKKKA